MNGKGELAYDLAKDARDYHNYAEQVDQAAARLIFKQNQLRAKPGEIDLHDLKPKEAQWILTKVVEYEFRNKTPILRVIVGKGKHSVGGHPKVKPAIIETCRQFGWPVHEVPYDPGVLEIDLYRSFSDEGEYDDD